jgi:lipopolysaccharide export system permease protein
MLRILDRYFLREIASSVIATVIVLLVIVAGGTMARVLQQVANGSYPASVMFEVLGLRMLSALSALLPLALFLGVLVALGRMYRDSEMLVLASSGMGRRGLLRPAAMLAVPAAILVGLVSLWLGPWAERTGTALVDAANRSVIAAGLDAGRFTELPGKGGIIFVDSMSRDGSRLGRVFSASDTPADKTHPERITVITARRGQLYQENNGADRFLALFDGWRFEVPLGQDNWTRMRYKRNDTALSAIAPDADDAGDPTAAARSMTLVRAHDPASRAELAWRIAAPVTALVLALLALPLARQTPRESRQGRLLLAVLAYFLYVSLVTLGKAMIEQGKWSGSAPIWALHLLVAAGAAWALWRQYAPWRVRGVRAA